MYCKKDLKNNYLLITSILMKRAIPRFNIPAIILVSVLLMSLACNTPKDGNSLKGSAQNQNKNELFFSELENNLSPGFDEFRSSNSEKEGKQFKEYKIDPVSGFFYVYATVKMGPVNPVEYIHNIPQWQPENNNGENASKLDQGKKEESREQAWQFFESGIEKENSQVKNLPKFLQVIELGSEKDKDFLPLVCI